MNPDKFNKTHYHTTKTICNLLPQNERKVASLSEI